MNRSKIVVAAVCAAVMVSGCAGAQASGVSAPQGSGTPFETAASQPPQGTDSATTQRTVSTTTQGSPTKSVPQASPFKAVWPTPPPKDSITGWPFTPGSPPKTETTADGRFLANGVLIVNKTHTLPRSYAPAWASKPHGLHPDVYAAANKLIAAAKADGMKLTIRSGYRSYATQAGSFARAMQQYDERTARKYFAEPGKSEHQTGLSFDVWDGKNRGTAFAQLPQTKWLAKNAHKFGFIIRYPQGKEHITGYAWESWHLRYVGKEIAAHFGPNSSLTLEEFLGIA